MNDWSTGADADEKSTHSQQRHAVCQTHHHPACDRSVGFRIILHIFGAKVDGGKKLHYYYYSSHYY